MPCWCIELGRWYGGLREGLDSSHWPCVNYNCSTRVRNAISRLNVRLTREDVLYIYRNIFLITTYFLFNVVPIYILCILQIYPMLFYLYFVCILFYQIYRLFADDMCSYQMQSNTGYSDTIAICEVSKTHQHTTFVSFLSSYHLRIYHFFRIKHVNNLFKCLWTRNHFITINTSFRINPWLVSSSLFKKDCLRQSRSNIFSPNTLTPRSTVSLRIFIRYLFTSRQ